MKLNPNCVRDVLLTTEDLTGYNQCFTYPSQDCPRLEQYTYEEVMYHIHQCGKSDFIEIDATIDNSFEVHDLTPAGHELDLYKRQTISPAPAKSSPPSCPLYLSLFVCHY